MKILAAAMAVSLATFQLPSCEQDGTTTTPDAEERVFDQKKHGDFKVWCNWYVQKGEANLEVYPTSPQTAKCKFRDGHEVDFEYNF
jgi:hypothetical protein